ILVLGGLLLKSREQPAFTTLSGGIEKSDGALLTVIFQPDTTEQQMRHALQDVGGTVVSGPSTLGTYIVKLRTAPKDAAATDNAINKLRAQPGVVRFVERQP